MHAQQKARGRPKGTKPSWFCSIPSCKFDTNCRPGVRSRRPEIFFCGLVSCFRHHSLRSRLPLCSLPAEQGARAPLPVASGRVSRAARLAWSRVGGLLQAPRSAPSQVTPGWSHNPRQVLDVTVRARPGACMWGCRACKPPSIVRVLYACRRPIRTARRRGNRKFRSPSRKLAWNSQAIELECSDAA